MKLLFLILLSFFVLTNLFAQKIEVSFGANSGLFHYSGNGTTSSSFINYSQPPFNSYPNYSFGNKNGFSYAADVQGQYIAKCGFIAGLQAGYDILRSKADITAISGESNSMAPGFFIETMTPVKGSSVVQNQFINLNPYVGYRLPLKKINIDLLIGFDLAFGVNSFERSSSTAADGTVYKTYVNYGKGEFDPRNRFGIVAYYKKFGVTASYAHGFINHSANLMNDSPIVYTADSELIRFGVTYRIL